GAALQRADGGFLADRSRNEDEGRVRAYLARQRERGHAVEARHRKVGQDQVWGEFAQRIDERLLLIHDPVVGVQAGAPQLEERKLGVVSHVFHQQNSGSLCHKPFVRIPLSASSPRLPSGLFSSFAAAFRKTKRRGYSILSGRLDNQRRVLPDRESTTL